MGDMARLTTRTTPDPDALQAELDQAWQRAHDLAVKLLAALTQAVAHVGVVIGVAGVHGGQGAKRGARPSV